MGGQGGPGGGMGGQGGPVGVMGGPGVVSAGPTGPQVGPDTFLPGQSNIKTRDLLYRLVISQLFYDGYQQVAVALSNIGQLVGLLRESWTQVEPPSHSSPSPHRPALPALRPPDAGARHDHRDLAIASNYV